MDRKSKIVLTLFCVLIVMSVVATFYKYAVLNDYDTYYDDYGEGDYEEYMEQ